MELIEDKSRKSSWSNNKNDILENIKNTFVILRYVSERVKKLDYPEIPKNLEQIAHEIQKCHVAASNAVAEYLSTRFKK